MEQILITGGAGFVGSNLAIGLKRNFPKTKIVALDNLKRRGSELTLPRLREHGITFVHGDVRIKEDLLSIGAVDLILDCSAEPSVLAGLNDSPDYVIHTNLTGTINCLELARIYKASLIFLSTSRVYPIQALNQLKYHESETRFVLDEKQEISGASSAGISETFPLEGARSLYGTSKFASELLLQEYIESYGIKGIINRCGVLTGPWQMGKVDQGVVVLWVAKHFFKKELSYIGYGGSGKQVRDILHVDDLLKLILLQINSLDTFNGEIFNVGGGVKVSVSLRELTELCSDITGNKIPIAKVVENRSNDVFSYITNHSKVTNLTGWTPRITPPEIIAEIAKWIESNKVALAPILS